MEKYFLSDMILICRISIQGNIWCIFFFATYQAYAKKKSYGEKFLDFTTGMNGG